ncbi:MAG: DUF5715 family protein [Porphyromonas sp.]|nr:DUF5715 family protein [Porphyromonas sp.]
MEETPHTDTHTPEPIESESRPPINWKPFWYRYFIPTIIATLVAVAWILLPEQHKDPYPLTPWENRLPYQYRGSFNRDFKDLNDIQLQSARQIGIEPAKTEEVLLKRKNIRDISYSQYYQLDELTHSTPVLVPVAADLLEEIGRRFRSTLERDTLPLYLPYVTSVTRTKDHVASLRRGNGNASANSTHCYATTFDISWKRFYKVDPDDPREIPAEELKHLLAIVLKELHNEQRCYIVHERRQACFHITARKSPA